MMPFLCTSSASMHVSLLSLLDLAVPRVHNACVLSYNTIEVSDRLCHGCIHISAVAAGHCCTLLCTSAFQFLTSHWLSRVLHVT